MMFFIHTKNTDQLGLFSDSRNCDAVMFWTTLAIVLGFLAMLNWWWL